MKPPDLKAGIEQPVISLEKTSRQPVFSDKAIF
jgi:hypothetical protein